MSNDQPTPGGASTGARTIHSQMPSRSRRTGGLTALLSERERLRDLGFLLGLSLLAMVGFAPTFTGVQFFLVGALGLLLGAGAAELARVRRWPGVAAILLTVAAFFLLGGPLCLRTEGTTAYLPMPSTLAGLVDQLIFGWKDLLTTLPPVDGNGPALVIPWVLGLVAGVCGALLLGAHRWRRLPAQVGVVLPVLVPVALLVTVILLGTQHAASVLLQGVAFAAVALAWLALRSLALATRTGTTQAHGFARRGLAGVALLGVASALAWPVGTWLAGADDERVVLRSYVEPPFDIGEYPSPLAGFRRYVKLSGQETEQSSVNLFDKTLMTVSGVPDETRIRFAALENYDGTVWRAAENVDASTNLDTYQRVSSTIDNPVKGEEAQVQVTLGEGYSDVWLPTVGALQHLTFEDSDSARNDAIEQGFRYNLAASTGIVPSGLRPGDTYEFTTVLPDDTATKDTEPSDELPAAYQAAAFLDTQANDWSQGETDPMARVFAAAEHLKTTGRFSDGVEKNEKIYHAGHSQKRLGDEFVNFPIMAGNAEQYAATMALLANRIGVPARVVMGAVVPKDSGGEITGADVTAWVELQAADGSWRTLPTEAFMGRQKPADQPPQQEEEMSGSVVPPPAPIPPPSTEGEQTDTQLKSRSDDKDDDGWHIPRWLQLVLLIFGSPLLLLALILGAILGAKAWRRRRRRTRGRPSARIGGGWRELVDRARDYGHDVPVAGGLTRREQAHLLDTVPAHELARAADGHVFGPTPPEDAEVTAYWQRVEEECAAFGSSAGRWARLKAALNLRTFWQRWAKEPVQVPPGTPTPEARNNDGHQLVDPS